MVKIEDLKSEYNRVLNNYDEVIGNKKAYRRVCERIRYLKGCIEYMESMPSEGLLLNEKQKIEDKIKVIKDRVHAFTVGRMGKSYDELKAEWFRKNNLKQLQAHHAMLCFLLSGE